MSMASREAKCTMPSKHAPGAGGVGAVAHDFVRPAARPACRTRGSGRHVELALRPRFAVGERRTHLGDHLAGADRPRPSRRSGCPSGRSGPRCAASRRLTVTPLISTGSSTAQGLSAPVRPTLIWMSLQPGDRDLGREFPGDGPARLPAADDAELALEVEPVDLHDHAVGLEREVRQQLLERGDPSCTSASVSNARGAARPGSPRPRAGRAAPCGSWRGSRPSIGSTAKANIRSRRFRVRAGSSWRRPPAAALRGLAKSGSPSCVPLAGSPARSLCKGR